MYILIKITFLPFKLDINIPMEILFKQRVKQYTEVMVNRGKCVQKEELVGQNLEGTKLISVIWETYRHRAFCKYRNSFILSKTIELEMETNLEK